jgi:hypothetical protein
MRCPELVYGVGWHAQAVVCLGMLCARTHLHAHANGGVGMPPPCD